MKNYVTTKKNGLIKITLTLVQVIWILKVKILQFSTLDINGLTYKQKINSIVTIAISYEELMRNSDS